MNNTVDVLSRLTPPMRAVLDKQNELASDAFATEGDLTEMRRRYAREREYWNEGGPKMALVADSVVPAAGREVPIRCYRPVAGDLPCLLYLHGGGFVVGNLDTHDRIMRTLAHLAQALVIGVHYSLSPEARFPQALHECAGVAEHVAYHRESFGLEPGGLSIAGDSGGASLALASALYLRDQRSDVSVDSLLLYYGMFGLRDSMSRRLYGGAWDGLAAADLDYYLSAYLARPQDAASPYVDLLSADLARAMPACYIAAAELDPLVDDSHALAAILDDARVSYRLEDYRGVLHAFLHHSRMLPESADALASGAQFFRAVRAGERP